MHRIAFVSLVMLFCVSVASAQNQASDKSASQAPAADSKIPAEDAKRPNPVKSTASSIADGKHLYDSQCLMCHGKDGDGKGDLATDMKLNLQDLRDGAALKDSTDGEFFYIISKGKGDMPAEGDRLSETQRWNLVNYIRSLASKTPPKTQDAKAKDDKSKDAKP
jgi:mono/diheme cytochrome c family protein